MGTHKNSRKNVAATAAASMNTGTGTPRVRKAKAVHAKAEKPAATATSGAKIGKGTAKAKAKAAGAKPAKKAAKAKGEPRASKIDASLPALNKALGTKNGASVDELRDSLGICRKSVRKLLAQVGAKKNDEGRFVSK